jgi:hypothetical protein
LEQKDLKSISIIEKEKFTLEDTKQLYEFFEANASVEFIQKVIDNKINFDVESLIYMMQTNTHTRAQENPFIHSVEAVEKSEKYKDIITLVDDDIKLSVVGDIHADMTSLRQILKKTHFYENYQDKKILFLGDYVDRGVNRLDVINLLIELEFLLPKNILILKGNHELFYRGEDGIIKSPMQDSENLSYFFTFLNFMSQHPEYGNIFTKNFIENYADYFENLPTLALLNFENMKILALHGGLPRPYLHVENYYDFHTFNELLEADKKDNIGMSLKNTLLWSDPYDGAKEGYRYDSSSRFKFNKEHFIAFCKKFGIDMMLRAHEAHVDGYKTYFDNRLISVFSSGQKDIDDNKNSDSYYESVTPNILEIDLHSFSIRSLEIMFDDQDMRVEKEFLFSEIKNAKVAQEQMYEKYALKNKIEYEKIVLDGGFIIKDTFNKTKLKKYSTIDDNTILFNYSELRDFYGIHKDLEFMIDVKNMKIINNSDIKIYVDRFILESGDSLPFCSGEYRFEGGAVLYFDFMNIEREMNV